MKTPLQEAEVYYCDKKAGVLRQTVERYEFIYDSEYIADLDTLPISLALPKRQEPFYSNVLFPFFQGLLAEGWLLEITCRTLKIDKDDKFALLLHTTQDAVGSVSVRRIT